MRKFTTKALILVVILIAVRVDVSAKRWRGLTPAHSTRANAARFAKECETANLKCNFQLKDSYVMLLFSSRDHGAKADCPKLPPGVLLAVIVDLKDHQPLKNFRLKNQKEISFDPSSPPNHGAKAYYYPKEGLIVSSFRGRVVRLVYLANQKDVDLCPEAYADPKGFVEFGIVR